MDEQSTMADEPGTQAMADGALDDAARQVIGVIETLTTLRNIASRFDTRVIDVMCQTVSADAAKLLIDMAGLMINQQIGMEQTNYTQWLLDGDVHAESRLVGGLVDHDGWPSEHRRHDAFRSWIAGALSYGDPMVTKADFDSRQQFGFGILDAFTQSWGEYWNWLQQRCGSWATSTTDRQYAVRLSWDNGETQMHPRTTDGVSRFEAEKLHSQALTSTTVGDSFAKAEIVTRVVTAGPWHTM